MSKGIIYVMTTAVSGLIKIGKTQTKQYPERMRFLEANGYYNVVGLKRLFAIEVADYSEKETLLHEIFAKHRVGSSELFALDYDLVQQLLLSFVGEVVFPEQKIKKQNLIKSPKPRTVIKSLAFIEKASKTAIKLSLAKTRRLSLKLLVNAKLNMAGRGGFCRRWCEKYLRTGIKLMIAARTRVQPTFVLMARN